MKEARSIEDLRRLARRRLPRAVFDFYDGGSEDELALAANIAAFRNCRLRHRVFVDVSTVDPSTTILGTPAAMPLIVAPMGATGFAWRGGDVAIARAAARAGVPYCLSTSANASIERIAREAPGRHWFQAYMLKQRDFREALIARAGAAGYDALILTGDLPVGGKRERDFRNHFSIPFGLTFRNFRDFASKPRWALPFLRHGLPTIENLEGFTPEATGALAIASSVGRSYDPAFDWDDVARIRDLWRGTLVLKGLSHPDCAERAIAVGADAVVVSNHGGRQLDCAMATLDALPAIVARVRGRIAVFVDGGVRRGSDIVKAIALGADAVLVGRAPLYGLCAGGEAGAVRALDILREELVRTMQLVGAQRIGDLGSGLLG